MKPFIDTYSALDIPNLSAMMNWDDKKKLYLIQMLSNSMLESAKPALSEEAYTQQMLDRFAGSWYGDESTEEIMANIKQSHSIRKPIDI